MQSLKNMLSTIKATISDSDTDTYDIANYVCDGCKQTVYVKSVVILFGDEKGKRKEVKTGCKCWELQQAREAKQEQMQRRVSYTVDRFNIVNPDLEKCTLENFVPQNETLKAIQQYAINYTKEFSLDKSQNIIFGGQYGLGKSHLAYGICKELNQKGFVAVFISVPKLLTTIKSTYNKDSNTTEAELLHTLSKVDFLVLDDIGAEKSNGDNETWANEKLFEIIDGRSGRSTLYTTNLNYLELSAKVGKRNFSRMMMNTESFKFIGNDYRLRNINF